MVGSRFMLCHIMNIQHFHHLPFCLAVAVVVRCRHELLLSFGKFYLFLLGSVNSCYSYTLSTLRVFPFPFLFGVWWFLRHNLHRKISQCETIKLTYCQLLLEVRMHAGSPYCFHFFSSLT